MNVFLLGCSFLHVDIKKAIKGIKFDWLLWRFETFGKKAIISLN